MESKNALAELAERLKSRIEHHGYAFDSHKQDDIKAQRIVAELAKLQFDANGKPNMYDAFHCAVNCRAIAEEGAGDAS